MYNILIVILIIFPFILFFIFKKNFSRKAVFLRNSIEELEFEKKLLENRLEKTTVSYFDLELELLEIKKRLLLAEEKRERTEEENQVLRKLLDELQKKQSSKNEDIVVEYLRRD